MYTIGQFSKIGKVSCKMLRHYDKIELFRPSFVHPDNQYRFYTKEQVQDILFINRLKMYGFSLEEIKQILESRQSQYLQEMMESKAKQLAEEIKSHQFVLQEIHEQIEKLKKGVNIMERRTKYDIQTAELKGFTVLSIRNTTSMENISSVIGKVFENIHRNGLRVTGHVMTIYYDQDFDPESADVEVCVPVDREFKSENISTRTLEGGLHVYTTHIGPYSEVGEAYGELMDWIKEEGYEITGAPFEKYIKGPEAQRSPKDFVTEVYFPVYKK
ncbi:MAG: MerR family transcriptional regulator [Bacillota bacterium]